MRSCYTALEAAVLLLFLHGLQIELKIYLVFKSTHPESDPSRFECRALKRLWFVASLSQVYSDRLWPASSCAIGLIGIWIFILILGGLGFDLK
jgi:hypothetical protein